MIVIFIILLIVGISLIVYGLKLSELDDEMQNLYELLSDYQMRNKENEN